MNMMLNEEFAKAEQANASETDASKNPALARMMKAWESKQAKNARKATGLGLVAVSLAACGGSSSSDDGDDDGDTDVGQVFTLTTGGDTFTGGDGDDVFNAPLASASGSLTGILTLQTLTQDDVLVGGDGEDTLNATLNGTGAAAGLFGLASPAISEIEIFNLTAVGAGGGLDLINSSGYEQLWNINSSASLTLVNVGEGAAIGMDGTAGGTTYNVGYTSSASADIMSQTVIANAVGGSTQSGLSTTLNVTDATGGNTGIENLDLIVSGGVRLVLNNSVDNVENLDIEGSGNLVLSGTNNFPNLISLDSTGYNEDLTLNVSGSAALASVMTGDGDDRITVNRLAMDGDFEADMGAGDNTLVVNNPTFTGGGVGFAFISPHVNTLDFGDVTNVQDLEFVQGFNFLNDITLDLSGFDQGLETVTIPNITTGNGSDMTIDGASEVMTLSVTGSVGMNTGLFTIEGDEDGAGDDVGVSDFTIDAGADIQLNGGLASTSLVNLTLTAGDDILAVLDGGLDELVTFTATATGENVDAAGSPVVVLGSTADVTFDNTNGDEFGSLETVAVSAAGDADLTMNGRTPVAQVQTFTIQTGTVGGDSGNYVFTLPDGTTVTAAGVASGPTTQTNIINAFNTQSDGQYTATSGGAGTILVTRNDPGEFAPIQITTVQPARDITNVGVTSGTGIDGAGFEALGTITVNSGENADVYLEDVYGEFTLEVTADDYAEVDLYNTNATSVTVEAPDSLITIGDEDDLHGNPMLETLTVSGETTDITLAGDLSGFTTLDLTGITGSFEVDATDAEYGLTGGDFVTYLVGGNEVDGSFDMAAGEREVIKFTDGDFGQIVIEGFAAGNDPINGDRLDLTDFGISGGTAGLIFEEIDWDGGTANAVRITDLGGDDFGGEIIVVGTGNGTASALSDDLEAYNVLV